MADSRTYAFAGLRTAPGRGLVMPNGRIVPLRPKSYGVLEFLLERPRRLVTREELMDAVWAPAVVTDGALTQSIVEIRRALGDKGRDVLRTVARRGFVLEADVEELTDDSPVSHPAEDDDERVAWPFPPTALAVLSFEDLDVAAHEHGFGKGIAERLVVYLSRIDGLVVQLGPAPQDLDFMGLGRHLGVGSFLTGTVQRSGSRIEVTARLFSAQTGHQMWAANYDRALEDGLALQREIARAITMAVEWELEVGVGTFKAPAINPARYGAHDNRAYEAYRKALDLKLSTRFLPNREQLRRILRHSLEAVEIDPEFAMGWLGLGVTYGMLERRTWSEADYVAERNALGRALALDPENAIVLGNCATAACANCEWSRTVELVEAARPWTDVLAVGDTLIAYTQSLINLDRWEAADAALDEAWTLSRRRPEQFSDESAERQHPVHWQIASCLVYVRRDYDGAVRYLEAQVNEQPHPGWPLICAYRAISRDSSALELFVAGLHPNDRADALHAHAAGGWTGMLNRVAALRAARGEQFRTRSSVLGNAELYAALGDAERLYACLEANLTGDGAARQDPVRWTLPVFDRYRDERRFRVLLERRGVLGRHDWSTA
jgi:DNA-binding winged helix-turn-helix (wHTH) protein/tetratricopeptide (TPR) repeat protein